MGETHKLSGCEKAFRVCDSFFSLAHTFFHSFFQHVTQRLRACSLQISIDSNCKLELELARRSWIRSWKHVKRCAVCAASSSADWQQAQCLHAVTR